MNQAKISKIFELFKKNNAHPQTELNFNSPFECLIAVLLSAQTTDVQVNKVTSSLYATANTPETILKLGEESLIEHIRFIGLFRNKAKNILATCQILVDQYQGQYP